MTPQDLTEVMTTIKHCLRFQTQPVPLSDPKSVIGNALQCSQTLLNTFKTSPSLTYIQLETLWQQKPATYQWFDLGLLVLVSRANQLSDTFIQHAMAGWLIANQVKTLANKVERQRLYSEIMRCVSGQHFGTLRIGIKQKLGVNSCETMQRSRAFDSLFMSIKIAAFLKQSKRTSLSSLASVLNQVILQYPQYQPLLNPLLDPSSEFFAGIVVKVENEAEIIVGAKDGKILLASLTKQDSNETTITIRHINATKLLPKLTIQRRVSPAALLQVWSLASPKQREHLTAIRQPAKYSIQYPPSDLLMILDALNKTNIEPTELNKLIGQNSFFTDVLQRSATELNRLNINVSNLKQSIMTHGTERLAAVLTEHLLWQRLSMSYFPLSEQFEQLCILHRQVCASIAEFCKLGIPQQFSLSALLQLSGLFTTSSLRILNHWCLANTDLSSAKSLTGDNIDIDFDKQALTLAKSWHQGREIHAPFNCYNRHAKSTNVYRDVQAISLYLCRQWLHCGPALTPTLPEELQHHCNRIKLNNEHIELLVERHCQAMYQPI